jgi:hypothetical protein
MRLGLYLFCDSCCLLAYLAAAMTTVRYQIPALPGIYAGWCAVACAAAWIGMVNASFRAFFELYGVDVLLFACALFIGMELARLALGSAHRQELSLATALALGTLLSALGGHLMERGFERMFFQAAAVALPISLAIALLGPSPLPEPAPQQAAQSVLVAPLPEVSR